MMNSIWKKRVSHHQKKMLRYLKYVLNDHFVIVCLFLLGALGYSYSEFLKTISTDFMYGRMIAVILFTGLLFIGKLATLLQPADAVFLLPKEKSLKDYLSLAKWHSFLLPASVIILGVGVLMPLLVATASFAFTDMLYFVVYLLIMKDCEFKVQHFEFKLASTAKRKEIRFAFLLSALIGNFVMLYFSLLAGIFFAVIVYVIWHQYEKRFLPAHSYQWQAMINAEMGRMQRIFQFINLFTDIPVLKTTVKRRQYLDGLLKRIKIEHQRTFLYLYSRAFLRGTEYSGLFVRLSLLAIVLVLFVESFVLSLLLALLFLYLTGFQLLPLYFHFDNMAMSVLYPVDQKQKIKAMKEILLILLLTESCGIGLASLHALPLMASLSVFFSLVLFSVLFSHFYLPDRIKKMEKTRRY
ncbi:MULTISPECIES: ABC transporter permease [Carnobacterium]|uniref:ABC transporter permease n=1 Tax=Carnobacterium antarcticum TaxID=2126436 RepID=A0ABW4NRW2_9LACT|nr:MULTISPECIES: ABC transporter permease [unclassified Carnobacterium]ALV23003.1 ABC transporter, permease protein EscB [Carnobacterium sp. CP1]QQP70876.1 ABC transporter permease [Carnobacterium sp. CS13]